MCSHVVVNRCVDNRILIYFGPPSVACSKIALWSSGWAMAHRFRSNVLKFLTNDGFVVNLSGSAPCRHPLVVGICPLDL